MRKILILGSKGFIGSSLSTYLKKKNYKIIRDKGRKKNNLLLLNNMKNLINRHQPEIIINCLGVVGGIQWGIQNKRKIILENNSLTTNLFNSICNKKLILINLIANCVYPYEYSKYEEKNIFNGDIHPSVFAYGMTRRNLLSTSLILNETSNVKSLNLILSNVYGPGDHFDEYRSHALGGLISKFYKAKKNNLKKIEIWGSGKPKRDWIYIDDVCDAILIVLKNLNAVPEVLNVASNKCVSIKNLALKIKSSFKYKGNIVFNKQYPDGDPIKKFSTKLINETINWKSKTNIDKGISKTVKYFLNLNEKK